jgi:hypothetical protein
LIAIIAADIIIFELIFITLIRPDYAIAADITRLFDIAAITPFRRLLRLFLRYAERAMPLSPAAYATPMPRIFFFFARFFFSPIFD